MGKQSCFLNWFCDPTSTCATENWRKQLREAANGWLHSWTHPAFRCQTQCREGHSIFVIRISNCWVITVLKCVMMTIWHNSNTVLKNDNNTVLRLDNTILRFDNNAVMRHYNTSLTYHNNTALRLDNNTALRHNNTSLTYHNNTALRLDNNTALRHDNNTALRHDDMHYSTAAWWHALRHYGMMTCITALGHDDMKYSSVAFFCFCFCVIFWTVVAVQRSNRRLHCRRFFFTHLTVQSMGAIHPWPLVIENWFLF